MARIGFIGLGNMGGPMARNLLKAGHAVVGFDLSSEARAAAQAAGVTIAEDAGAATAGAEIVVTMLPEGRHVRAVVGDILPRLDPAVLLVDSSTIDVATARALSATAAEAGVAMLDAPVSGGVIGAEAATLTFMVGGSDAAFSRARPVLEAMGRTIVHAGPAGNGQVAKICNNMIAAISMIGVAEAFVLAETLGLEAQTLFDISSKSSGQCWSMTSYCPVPGPVPAAPSNRDYQPGFAAALMLKDLKLAQQAAADAGAATPLGAQAAALYQMFVGAGHGGRDFSGILAMLRGR